MELNPEQFNEKPWGYTDHMTAREIVNNYDFSEGNIEGLTGLEWKTRSAYNEPLPFVGGWSKFKANPEEENIDKQVMPGWNGYLGKMIETEGYKEDYEFPIHVIDDHPTKGKLIIDGQHRVAVMYKLHPDQKIRVFRSNYKYAVDHAQERLEKHRKRVRRLELNEQLRKEQEEGNSGT